MTDSPPKRTPGITCPHCKSPLQVLDTRTPATGVIARRRFCPTCSYRVTTHERPAPRRAD